MSKLLSVEILRQLLAYEPDTGSLFWKVRDGKFFTNPCRAASWNARYAGQQAFIYLNEYGYPCGCIKGKKISAHRVIWALVHGEWPEEVDHINGVRCDNRLSNLRAVTKQENGQNQRLPKRNKSGVAGVRWLEKDQRWLADIKYQQKTIYLGRFFSKQEAVAARRIAEVKYGFHPNHGSKAA